MFQNFKISDKPAYAKVLLYGMAGVGKTVFALSHPGVGYLIDTEGEQTIMLSIFEMSKSCIPQIMMKFSKHLLGLRIMQTPMVS